MRMTDISQRSQQFIQNKSTVLWHMMHYSLVNNTDVLREPNVCTFKVVSRYLPELKIPIKLHGVTCKKIVILTLISVSMFYVSKIILNLQNVKSIASKTRFLSSKNIIPFRYLLRSPGRNSLLFRNPNVHYRIHNSRNSALESSQRLRKCFL
jgi:hypothetical protein